MPRTARAPISMAALDRRRRIRGNLGPRRVLEQALTPEAGRAVRDTLAGAVGAAQRLPEQVGIELINAARGAFVHGFELTAAVSAVIAAALAVLAGVVLRNVRTGTALEESALEDDELDHVAGEFSG
jgi:MFS transporter, DHA2 family, multidrug resistance protein